IFNFFTSKNIALSPKKSFIAYPNIELLNFKIDILKLLIINEKIVVFQNLEFLNTLKSLKQYINVLKFIRYFILYYTSLIEPL
ncbi:hypothetical protein GE21DRAFT_1223704, partial [Neurospora crassa]